ncbi:MAG: SRPBCC family protein [Salinivirgaceae bacterium]|nr:SRPBCC family protein [Salinivirgaceae bacterium]
MSFKQLIFKQKIPASVNEVWEFISSPSNLSKITPAYMGFEITSKTAIDKMYEGMIISYKVSPVSRLKTIWVTEITHIKENEYFVDEQRIGPYAMWHHEHLLEPIENGVLMTDIISYKPPYSFLGSFANWLFIQRKLMGIFKYRFAAVEEIFGVYK